MKLQKLEIHNIASIEDASVDFEREPLSDSEIFLITGKTGSGKSTILDAICLALYASTPRLASTKIEGKVREGDQQVTVGDPRQLLRKGKGEGYVKLDFIGTDRVPYRAEWIVRRAHSNPDGKLQPKEWRLRDLSRNVSYNKDAEIKALMANAIGLTFEQFCRTTMLAQGEFTRFLNSEDSDKSAILEKITGVNVYTDIGKAIYRITDEKAQLLRAAEILKTAIDVPSQDKIDEMNETLMNARAEQKKLENQSENLASKLTWLGKYVDALAKVSESKEALQRAEAALESDDYKKNSRTVVDWNASEHARDSYLTLMRLRHEKEGLENILAAQKKKFQALLGASEWDKEQVVLLEARCKALEDELKANTAYRDIYANEQTISSSLRHLKATVAKISSETARLEESVVQSGKRLSEKQSKQVAYDVCKDGFDKANANLEAAQGLFDHFGLSKYRETANALNARHLALTGASGSVDLYTQALEALNDAKDQEREIESRIESLKVKIEEWSTKVAEAQTVKKFAEDVCKKLESSVSQWAKAVRSTLSAGDECPVCRRKVESLPAENEMDQVYKVARDAFEQAKDRLDQVQRNYDKAVSDRKAFEAQLVTAADNVRKQERMVRTHMDNLTEALEKVGLALSEGVGELLQTQISQIDESIRQNREKIQEGESLERSLTLRRNELEAIRSSKDAAFKDLNDADSRLKSAEQEIKTMESLINEQEKSLAQTVEGLQVWLEGFGGIDIDWKVRPGEYSTALKALADDYLALVANVDEAKRNLQARRGECDALLGVIGQILLEMPEWNVVKAEDKMQLANAMQKANEVLAESRSCKRQLSENDCQVGECEKTVSEFLDGQNDIDLKRLAGLASVSLAQITMLNGSLEKARTEMAAAESVLDDNDKSLRIIEKEKPEFADGQTKESLEAKSAHLKEEIARLGKEVLNIENELKRIAQEQDKEAGINQKIAQAREEHEKWARMNKYFGDAEGVRFRKIAQSYILANLIRAANTYMKTLTDRYTLTVEPGEFVIMVEDSYQGFAKRATSTISGGESFLVSLSLALALSDIGHTLAVDTLFIDEGFGTLSGDPLTKAIETLRTLQHKSGRKVGIISHVDELKAKIPVQIQVVQDGNSSKSTIKIV